MSKNKKDKKKQKPSNGGISRISRAIEEQLAGREASNGDESELPPWEKGEDANPIFDETVTEHLRTQPSPPIPEVPDSETETEHDWETSAETVITGKFHQVHAEDFGGSERLFSEKDSTWRDLMPSLPGKAKKLYKEKGSPLFEALADFIGERKGLIFTLLGVFLFFGILWFAAFRVFQGEPTSTEKTTVKSQSTSLPLSPPEEIPENFVSVQVRTIPPGARIFVNGVENKDLTPLTLSELIPKEKYLIQIQKEGFESVQETLIAQDEGHEILRFNLTSEGFLIRANSIPKGAYVLMNKKLLGKTPLEKKVNPKKKRIFLEFRLKGYKTFSKEFPVTSKPLLITPTLFPERKQVQNPNVGYLTMEADPVAVVYLNGKRLNSATPIRRLKLKPGRYKLRFLNPHNQKSRIRKVTILKGKERKIKVNLR